MSSHRIVVTGAGGFIGGHLVQQLRSQGRTDVTAVDIKPTAEWFQLDSRVDNVSADLQDLQTCRDVMSGASVVYNLAADMGGMGFIEKNKALCMLSVLINTHLLIAARDAGVQRYFYSSSACVYNASRQAVPGVAAPSQILGRDQPPPPGLPCLP